jgi:hypothetical protein
LGTTVTNQNCFHEEIRSTFWGMLAAFLFRVLTSCLPSKSLKIKTHKTIILPIVLYGCETWSVTLREEHRLRVFEKWVRRRIFGRKREEVAGGWRRVHNEELQ